MIIEICDRWINEVEGTRCGLEAGHDGECRVAPEPRNFLMPLVGKTVRFEYTNWKDVTEQRTVIVTGVDYGANEWYSEQQFFLRGVCQARFADRSFAIAKIVNFMIDSGQMP